MVVEVRNLKIKGRSNDRLFEFWPMSGDDCLLIHACSLNDLENVFTLRQITLSDMLLCGDSAYLAK